MNQDTLNFDTHVSVDCVILGFDGESLKVLLTKRGSEVPAEQYNNLKLPGRLIHTDEDLEDAANDIINSMTGLHPVLHQFRAYGSPSRTSNPKDVLWLENAINQKIERIVTISYLSLVYLNRTVRKATSSYGNLESDVVWYPVNDLPQLAFDHNQIVQETLKELERLSDRQPKMIFDMLPQRFTAAQLRKLYEQICNHPFDVRNFSKLVLSKPYIIPLDEYEQNVSHRAARYYKFKKI